VIKVVQIRLVAETEADALAAIEMLVDGVGSVRLALSTPHEGRKGGWLSYGTLQVDSENARYAAERAAATGPTTRLRKRTTR
jgi:hypothetical protein